MSFYTSVVRYGNSLFYRGYTDTGKRFYKNEHFSPRLFVPAKVDTKWRGLDGSVIGPVAFNNMREAKQSLEQYKDDAGFNIYGHSNFRQQFVAANLPQHSNSDPGLINVKQNDL